MCSCGARTRRGRGRLARSPRPDLTGLWIGPTADISVVLLPGEEVSLTPYGAERYRKVDQAKLAAYKCLPYGPTRGLQSTNPFSDHPDAGSDRPYHLSTSTTG